MNEKKEPLDIAKPEIPEIPKPKSPYDPEVEKIKISSQLAQKLEVSLYRAKGIIKHFGLVKICNVIEPPQIIVEESIHCNEPYKMVLKQEYEWLLEPQLYSL